MTTRTMEIGGMTCGHCLMAVRNALEGMAGVQVDEVRIGKAVVRFDEGAVKPEDVDEAIRDVGYDVVSAS